MKLFGSAADQAFLSLGNLLLTLAAARLGSREEFVAFSLIFTSHLVGMAVARANFGEVLLVTPNEQAKGIVSVAALAFGGWGILVAVVAGAFWSWPQGILAGLASGLSLFFDLTRYFELSQQRFGLPAFLDSLLPAGLIVIVLMPSTLGTPAVYAVWILTSAVGSLTLLSRYREHFGPLVMGWRWRLANQVKIRLFIMESLASSAGYQLVLLGGAVLAGSYFAAGMRGAQVFAGPLGILFLGAVTAFIGRAIRMPDRGLSLRFRIDLLALALAVLISVAAVFISRDAFGLPSSLFGSQWVLIAGFVPPAMLYASASMLNLAPVVLIRSSGMYRYALHARVINSLLLLLALPVAAFVDGLAAAWILGLGNVLGCLFWRRALGLVRRDLESSRGLF